MTVAAVRRFAAGVLAWVTLVQAAPLGRRAVAPLVATAVAISLAGAAFLPLAKPYDVDVEDRRRLEHELRDIDFNADRHGLGPKADSLIAEKRELIAAQMGAQTTGLTRRERRLRTPANRERFQQLTALSKKLAALAGEQRARLQQQLADVDQKLAVNQILTDREFSLALYPPEVIRRFYESALDVSAS